MNPVDLIKTQTTPTFGGRPSRRVEVPLLAGSDRYDLYFSSGEDVLVFTPECLLALSLLPAMKRGMAVNLEGNVSARLLQSLTTIQDIYRTWGAALKPVEIHGAVPKSPAPSPTGRVATFFSGGVDSFYTLLKHQSEITDIIFVHGFDIRIEKAALRATVADKIREVGAELGKTVIEIETNLRSFLDPHVAWGEFAHGAALATIAHLLSHRLDRVYIAATYTYKHLVPRGSHPVLDGLWSTESLEIVHDGCEAGRVDKVARLAESETALRTLRVCYLNPGGAYNCGRCEKCIRTMINLRVANALHRCTTFPMPLDMNRVRKLRADNPAIRPLISENLKALRAKNVDPELQAALKGVLKRPPRLSEPLRRLVRPVLSRYPRISRVVRLLRGTA